MEHNLFEENEFLSDSLSDQVSLESDQVSDQVNNSILFEKTILDFCIEPRTFKEILARTGYSSRNYFRKNILKPLIDQGLIELTQPDSPNSPTQKYKTVVKKQ